MNEACVVWLAGATGLVGGEALRGLLSDARVQKIVSVTRRPTSVAEARLDERVVDFDALEPALAGTGGDVAVCCLGTTIKQAGSQAAFRRVDHDYPLAFARAARAAGVHHFLVVTALGADSRSRIFYNRVKGELEDALAGLGFPAFTSVRPSLLIGERSAPRLGERLAAPLSRLLPRSIRGIEARKVGRALVSLALAPPPPDGAGRRIVLSGELHALGA
ncbi:MAG: NAD(P)H-binding protein [Polyangiales bacterium]